MPVPVQKRAWERRPEGYFGEKGNVARVDCLYNPGHLCEPFIPDLIPSLLTPSSPPPPPSLLRVLGAFSLFVVIATLVLLHFLLQQRVRLYTYIAVAPFTPLISQGLLNQHVMDLWW